MNDKLNWSNGALETVSTNEVMEESPADLRARLDQANKIIEVLMDRAELGINTESSDFSLFQTTVLLEKKVRTRTQELEQALETIDESRTALEHSLEQLKRTQQRLVESEKMAALGHLVAGISHEVSTPVGVGVTAASLLSESTRELRRQVDQGRLTRDQLLGYLDEMAEGTRLINENLHRAGELVSRFKQTAVNQVSYDHQEFELGVLVDSVCDNLRLRLQRQSVQVSRQGPPIRLRSYPGPLTQILTNLIINSLIHGFEEGNEERDSKQPQDAEKRHISIRLAHQDGQVEISYQDNGRGLTACAIGHIFEPFYTTRRGAGGTGLGLHICYNLISEVLGGTIECESPVLGGALFRLRFPLQPTL